MPLIYHYTNSETLQKILDSNVLWATDVRYMNDSTELSYLSKPIVEALNDKKREIPILPPDPYYLPSPSALHHETIDYLSSMVASHDFGEGRKRAYATCFSAAEDKLSQWRGYANPDGFAIGFDSEILNKIPISLEDYAKLYKVTYGNDGDYINLLLNEIVNNVANDSSKRPSLTAAAQYNDVILPKLISIKHQGFQEEEEYRLVVFLYENNPLIMYNSFNNLYKAYVHIPIPEGALKKIIVGPSTNLEYKKRWLSSLLSTKSNLAETVVIQESTIPLRV